MPRSRRGWLASPPWRPTAAAGSAAAAWPSVAQVQGGGPARRCGAGARVALGPGPPLGRRPGGVARDHRDRLRRGLGEIAPVMRAAALGALERAAGDEPRRGGLALEVEPVLPGEVVGSAPAHRDGLEPACHILDLDERTLEPLPGSNEPHVLPHDLAELGLQGVEVLALVARERRADRGDRRVHERGRDRRRGAPPHPPPPPPPPPAPRHPCIRRPAAPPATAAPAPP